jgi:hypothetical protein
MIGILFRIIRQEIATIRAEFKAAGNGAYLDYTPGKGF